MTTPAPLPLNKAELENWQRLVNSPTRNGHEIVANINTMSRLLATISARDETIAGLRRTIENEIDARNRMSDALREKDKAMGVLFERLNRAGVDCSDLIS